MTKQLQNKDSLIQELTAKLRESTKVIQKVKENYKNLKEDQVSKHNEQQLMEQIKRMEQEFQQ